MRVMVFVILAVVLVSACAPAVEEEVVTLPEETVIDEGPIATPETPPALEQCAAAGYRQLIGTQLADAQLVGNETLRIYEVTEIITQEYLPQRTNIVFDADGLIARVYCG